LDSANKRRDQQLAAHKIKHRDYMSDLIQNPSNAVVTQTVVAKHNVMLSSLREIISEQKDLIGYREYIQFCQDFSLKSTSLLTAIQVGEVFLNLVPLNLQSLSESGMSFELFKRAVLYMAFIAYQRCHEALKPVSKVKALLLFMWKAVNDSDKTMQMVRNDRSNKLSSHAGSLNLFGSGLFSDSFLAGWIKDGFPDYTDLKHVDGRSDLMILRSISDDLGNSDGNINNKSIAEEESNHLDSFTLTGSASRLRADSTTPSLRSTALSAGRSGSQSNTKNKTISSIEGLNLSALSLSPLGGLHYSTHKLTGLDGDEEEDAVHIGGFDLDGELDGEMHSPKGKLSRRGSQSSKLLRPPTNESGSTVLTLKGADIAKLLQRKPELVEFLELQIREMLSANNKE